MNESPILGPEIIKELLPCFDSPPNLNYHNETSIDDLDNLSYNNGLKIFVVWFLRFRIHIFSYNVESTNVSLDGELFEDDEMKRVNSSTHEKLRSIIPMNITSNPHHDFKIQ